MVIWTPPRLGGGNHLYLWMAAWESRMRGESTHVLEQPGMHLWTELFPALRDLTISSADVTFTMNRSNVWFHTFDEFGTDTLDGFLNEVLLSSPAFQARLESATLSTTPSTLTVNVRRGDYYTNDEFRHRYSMDHEHLMHLVREELLPALQSPSTDRALAVSDDPVWCQAHLPGLLPLSTIQPAPRGDLFDDLAHLAVADRLLLTNSTFSYWGGYLNDALSGAQGLTESRVWAPTFHDRAGRNDRSGLLSPRWNLLENHIYERSRELS